MSPALARSNLVNEATTYAERIADLIERQTGSAHFPRPDHVNIFQLRPWVHLPFRYSPASGILRGSVFGSTEPTKIVRFVVCPVPIDVIHRRFVEVPFDEGQGDQAMHQIFGADRASLYADVQIPVLAEPRRRRTAASHLTNAVTGWGKIPQAPHSAERRYFDATLQPRRLPPDFHGQHHRTHCDRVKLREQDKSA